MTGTAVSTANGLARIVLGSPESGSAINLDSVDVLAAAVGQARDADCRVVVLSSSGPAFCVGGDLNAFAGAQSPRDYIDELADRLHRVISELMRMDAVVVSVVKGVAAGAGFPLAAAADIVLAGESARFTMSYTKIGLTPDGGSSLLTASLGLHRSLYLALVNPVLSAADALAAGLVAAVHPDDEVDAAAERLVASLLAGSRAAQVGAKRLLRDLALPCPESAMRLEALSIREAADGHDGREGVKAFLDKRRPSFRP